MKYVLGAKVRQMRAGVPRRARSDYLCLWGHPGHRIRLRRHPAALLPQISGGLPRLQHVAVPAPSAGGGGVRPPAPAGGWSPLYKADRLARALGLDTLYLKDDGQNPTSSLKDRASALAVVKAREAGADTIACSSTGNAASSLAGNAAAAGLSTYIFVPSRAPRGKVAQLRIFGATVISVEGSYEDTFELSRPPSTAGAGTTATPPSTLPLRGQKDCHPGDSGAARLADA